MQSKQYIGDGVYLEVNGPYDIVLTTENGIDTTNTVTLDITLLKKINEFIEMRFNENLEKNEH